ncbi:MAG: hypothetical protein ACXAC8_05355 [Candidatus Hodarchaeales archaeon]
MNMHSVIDKPVVYLGNYLDGVKQLFCEGSIGDIKPKILWIDYREIPVFELLKSFHSHSHLMNQLFFLQLSNLNVLSNLLRSNELFSLSRNGFNSMIIDIPEQCVLPHDSFFRFKELAKTVRIILLMATCPFPLRQTIVIHTESSSH